MKRKFLSSLLIIGLLTFGISCSNSKTADKIEVAQGTGEPNASTDKNDILTGEMTVIVDEAATSILNEQLEVFRSSYVNTKIQVISKPEREAINSLIQGDGSMAILARELTERESAGFGNRQITPRIFPIWNDGVVFVNNISSPDTSINVQTLSSLMKGDASGKTLLLDNINSSMVRKVKEFSKVDQISAKSVQAMKTSTEVLKQIETNVNAIGIVSYSQYLDYRRQFGEENKIRILSLQNTGSDGKTVFTKPSQTTFATEEYPLKTTFYVLNYQPNMGLGIGFSAFLTGDRGQRVVLKSGLLPVTMPGREILIRDNIN